MITHSKNLSLSNYCLCFQKSGGIKVRSINNEENIIGYYRTSNIVSFKDLNNPRKD